MQCTNNDISRRSFISSAALAGAASIAVPALAMADDKDATVPEKGTWKGYTPGTYSSDAMGHNAPFTVNVTFTDYALSDIDTDAEVKDFYQRIYGVTLTDEQVAAMYDPQGDVAYGM